MRTFAARSLALLAALILGSTLLPSPAAALTVTSDDDAGAGSLRQVLAAATDGDTIDFALAPAAVITLASELVVAANVTIAGPGASALTIDGDAGSRVFHVSPSALVTISDLTVANGNAGDDGGGGIYNEGGSLTLRRVVVRQCVGSYGGGILNDAGGASSSLTVVDSTVDDNQTTGASGGGIYNDGTTNVATLVVERCTISRNTASGTNSFGGGILNSGFASGEGTATVRASTISGNTAAGNAGGIANTADFAGQATIRIANSTFASNAGIAGGAVFSTVFADGGTADLEIGNTILRAGASGGTIANGVGSVVSAGFNLASDGAGGDATTGPGGLLGAASDRRNTDPLLGLLQANGGPTFTHALLAGSPAIDQGRRDTIPTLADAVDQRANPRPADDPAVTNATGGEGSDVGAFEVQPPGDLAVTALKVPKRVTLKANKPTVAKTIKVTIQNRGALPAVIPDLATLAALVDVEGTALGLSCAAPAAALVPGKPKLPATIKSKKKLTAVFTATFTCAGDPLKTTKKDPGHDDVRWVATVDRTALGTGDEHPDDDVCPRPTLPNGIDPRPDPAKPIKDKGCGGKLPDKTLGAEVRTDVVVK